MGSSSGPTGGMGRPEGCGVVGSGSAGVVVLASGGV